MSTELAVLDLNLPDYLRELEVDATTKALMGGSNSSKRISIRGSVWRMLVNGKELAKNEDRHLNVVIVAAAPTTARTYYSKEWVEGEEPSAPECWSANGEFPDAKATNPQAKRCMDCPMNIKGSGRKGDTRACRYSQRLAVVLANNLEGDVFQLTLPATSLFGEGTAGKWPLQTYAKMIGSKGVPITAVVTEMRFDTEASTPKVTFKPARVLTAAEHQIVVQQGASAAAISAITMTVSEADGVKAVAHQQPESVEEPKAEEPKVPAAEPEPVKRTKKSAEPVAEKADLSKILADWDD